MTNKSNKGDLSEKLRSAMEKARLKFLKSQTKINGIVIIADQDGNIKRVPAKELLQNSKNKS